MADVNIFEKYGIKQVANVYFEALSTDEAAGVYEGDIVLYLDTLKVSTIETTAENVAAQGGWGNPRLIQWDYGKEINVTLTDALISLESLKFMLGGAIKKSGDEEVIVHRTAETTVKNGTIEAPKDSFTGNPAYPYPWKGHPIKVLNLTKGWRTQINKWGPDATPDAYNKTTAEAKWANDQTYAVTFANDMLLKSSGDKPAEQGDVLRFFWDEAHTQEGSAVEVTISSNTFPGTYRVVGDTFMRDTKGKDVPFQFIIEQAKVQSNVTITLEAEGDPSTFDMTLNVLRASEGHDMMRLVRYGDADITGSAGDDIGSIGQQAAANSGYTQVPTSQLTSEAYSSGNYYVILEGQYVPANAVVGASFNSEGVYYTAPASTEGGTEDTTT